jgi:hypothetical protein
VDILVRIIGIVVRYTVEETEVVKGRLGCVTMGVRRDGVDLSVELKVRNRYILPFLHKTKTKMSILTHR